MKSDKSKLFSSKKGDQKPDSQPLEPIKTRFWESIKAFVRKHKFSATVGVLAFLWAGPGEVFLAHPYRFSTFIGMRTGRTASEQTLTSLPAEVQRQEVTSATAANIELRKGCEQTRNQLAQQAYAQCIQQNGSKPVCDYRVGQILASPCDTFTPDNFVEDYINKRKGR